MNYNAKIRRAYRLYVQYKTHTNEYKRLASELGYEGTGALNSHLCGIYNAKLAERNRKRWEKAQQEALRAGRVVGTETRVTRIACKNQLTL